MASPQTHPLTDRNRHDRAAVNRANSQHSTGPVTAEGKQAVRWNALKTGVYALTVLLPHEDPQLYAALGESLAATFQPETDEETDLLQSIVDNRWRVRRLVEMETNLVTLTTFQQIETIHSTYAAGYEAAHPGLKMPEATVAAIAQAAGFQANARLFEQLSRQQGRLNRAIEKSTRDLRQLIANRPAQTAPPIEPGFVPPKSETPEVIVADARKPGILDGVPPHILDRMPVFAGNSAEMHQAQWLKKHWNPR